MQGFSVLALVLCVAISLNLSHGSRIAKRWAFFAKNDDTLKVISKNCDDIVEQYSNGQLIMYEYKIKMKRCLKGLKDGVPERKASITSKYDDDSSESFFKHAMKYVNDEGGANFEEDESGDKKDIVPSTDAVMPNGIPAATDAAAGNFYPNPDQTLDQQPNYGQRQAAFTQNTMSNQAFPEQQNYNYYTRSNIPAAPQQQQNQQDMNQQWNAPMADTKKDTLPAAPADDPFANFMNMQASSNAAPQELQQRSDIPAQADSMTAPQAPQQRSDIPVDAAYQAPAAPAAPAYPANQQAFFRDHVRAWSPEEHGMFPENP